MKIGDTVWVFDPNRRVYEPGSHGPPIYREHFVAQKIIGETRISWLVGSENADISRNWTYTKYKKKDPYGIYTAEEVEAKIWLNDHGYETSQRVMRCKDVAALKAIVALLDAVDAQGMEARQGGDALAAPSEGRQPGPEGMRPGDGA
jgi:hypothetical protein